MRCFKPITITLPKPRFDSTQKKIVTRMQVPCGRCEACLERKRLEWFVRLREEHKHSVTSYFVTLTYDETFVPFTLSESGEILYHFDKRQVQLFLKRFRNFVGSFRYYLISEYGGTTYRPHYHMHLFGLHMPKEQILVHLERAWPYGLVHIGSTTDSSINYVAGHIQFISDTPPGFERPWSLMSRRPGIGAQSLANMSEYLNNDDVIRLYHLSRGKAFLLPRYYQSKLFTPDENIKRSLYLSSHFKEQDLNVEEIRQFKRKVDKRRKLRIAKKPI